MRNRWIAPSVLAIALVSSQRPNPLGAARATNPPRREQATRTLRIIGTNDFHGALDARPDARGVLRGGAAAVAGAIETAERECVAPSCTWILLDGGDEFQGTPASNFAFGRPVVEMFNTLGLSAAAIGNHEFDWGQDTLRALMRAAHYHFLAANIRTRAGKAVPWIHQDTLIKRGSLTIGVIGVSTKDTPTTTRAVNVDNLEFVDAAPIVDSLAPELRRRGAQVVVIVAHAGGQCSGAGQCQGEILDLAAHLTHPVDAIVSGHSHTRIATTVHGIPVVQAESRGLAIDVVDLPIGDTTARPRIAVREIYTDSVPHDSAIAAIADRAIARVAPQAQQPIAEIAQAMPLGGREFALGDLVADGMRVVGHGDIGLMNTGGLRAPLHAGVATYGALFEVQPFGDVLYRVRVRGGDLRAYFARVLSRPPNFHVSGVRIVYENAPTARIDSLLVDGRPLDDLAIYTVVVSDFSMAGGDNLGFGPAAISEEAVNVVDLDATIAYLKTLKQPVQPPAGGRIQLVTK